MKMRVYLTSLWEERLLWISKRSKSKSNGIDADITSLDVMWFRARILSIGISSIVHPISRKVLKIGERGGSPNNRELGVICENVI